VEHNTIDDAKQIENKSPNASGQVPEETLQSVGEMTLWQSHATVEQDK